jgi:hypothetical protein
VGALLFVHPAVLIVVGQKMIELQADKRLFRELQEMLSMHRGPGEVLVSRRTLRNALLGVIEERFDAEEITRWANQIEVHDSIMYEVGFESLLATLIFRLATPEINEAINQGTCRQMLEELCT